MRAQTGTRFEQTPRIGRAGIEQPSIGTRKLTRPLAAFMRRELAATWFRVHDRATSSPHGFPIMSIGIRILWLGLPVLLIATAAAAQSYDASALQLMHKIERQPNELARYKYLAEVIPKLTPANKNLAEQFLAFSQNELGVYGQAIFSFPLKSRLPADLVLPTAAEWEAADATDALAKLAADRRIVLINEAHHDAHTRQLTLALLPRLKALGFTHFAAEALSDDDPDLTRRGFPISTSGTEYLREPLYGDIVRAAIRLGFIVVAYDTAQEAQAREDGQADNLYQKVFAKDSSARLFVHAGYAHIDKAKGRLNHVAPMAMRLQALTGIDPLSIDQIEFLESSSDTTDAYHRLINAFPLKLPEVLINRRSGKPWSDRPALYDVNVILPPARSMLAFGDESIRQSKMDASVVEAQDILRFSPLSRILNHMQRPAWISLEGLRQPVPITTTLCRTSSPCVVDAHYIDEPDDATAADRYAFMTPNAASKLYLRPGRYRLRAWDIDGKALSERSIEVTKP